MAAQQPDDSARSVIPQGRNRRVCIEIGVCGIRLVCLPMNLTNLDRSVAASYGAQQAGFWSKATIDVCGYFRLGRSAADDMIEPTNDFAKTAPSRLPHSIFSAFVNCSFPLRKDRKYQVDSLG
jgi:hypothetical protein